MKPNKLFHLLIASTLVLSMLLGAAPAQASQAEAAAPSANPSPEGLLNPDGSLNLSTGFQGTLDLNGWEVTLDSQRGPLFSPADPDRTASSWAPGWSAASNQGLNGQVYTLAVIDTYIYMGGTFSALNDDTLTSLGNIVRYSASSNSWYALPDQGLNGGVYAMAVMGSNLYVGGDFTATGTNSLTDLGNIARFDTSWATWYAMPDQGLNGGVYAMAVVNESNLYVGGYFTATGNTSLTSLGSLAIYNTIANAWYALTNQGVNDVVRTLAVDGNDLYIGGTFNATGDGSLTNLGSIARYDTLAYTWHALPNQGLNGWVFALALAGGNIYAGGAFTSSGDSAVTNLNNIARYDKETNTWDSLPNGGLNSYVYKLLVVGDDLYLGGSFSGTADSILNGLGCIVRYDLHNDYDWLTLPNGGMNGEVTALATAGSDVYAGGYFTATSDGVVTNLGRFARYNFTPNVWSAIPNDGLEGQVQALAVTGHYVYVGGQFNATQDGLLTNMGNIACYDSLSGTWYKLPYDGLNGAVFALLVIGKHLYVGGEFSATGDNSVTNLNGIARYDIFADTWNALPNNGLDGAVYTLLEVADAVYVGGYFTATSDGVVTDLGSIARYDTIAGNWSALPQNGLNGAVNALAWLDAGIYVGGSFNATGSGGLTNLGNIALYDILAGVWQALPNQGLNGDVYALAADGSDLYVGGAFSVSGDATLILRNIARFDTQNGAWHALPQQGLNLAVSALAVVETIDYTTELYVGGTFMQTGDSALTDLGSITRYNVDTSNWQVLPNRGMNGNVNALAVGDGGVFVGGTFNSTRDGKLNSKGIIHYGDIAWRPLANHGLNGEVEAMAVIGTDLYVGGRFTATGDGALDNLGYIARYDTVYGDWYALPNQGLNYNVYALAVIGDDLYVGGGFDNSGDGTLPDLNYIARYDTTTGTWHALPRQGLDEYVRALAVVQGDLYVGGDFTNCGNGSMINLNYIARYSTAANDWQVLSNQGMDANVEALEVLGDYLYVGGAFAQTNDGAVSDLNYIARYNMVGEAWEPMPQQGLDGYVYAFAAMGTDLYVGGDFNDTYNGSLTDLDDIVRYDSQSNTWHALPNQGLSGSHYHVYALVVIDSSLYVGGGFEKTGDETLNELGGLARYDSTNDMWYALPNEGMNGYRVNALAVIDKTLYAGGDFEASGDGTLNNLGGMTQIRVHQDVQSNSYTLYLPLVVKR